MATRDRRVGEDQTEAGTEASGEVGEATGTKRSGARIVGRVADKVVLIDGETLANLMIDHSVGVSLQRSYEVKRVDSDYFSEA
jgi:restriction endonuclease Mrr